MLISDPRHMSLKELTAALTIRGLPAGGLKEVLAARLTEAIVAEGKSTIKPQREYARDSPERWALAYSRAMAVVHKCIPDGNERADLQQRVMDSFAAETAGLSDEEYSQRAFEVADEELDGSAEQAMRVWFCAFKLYMSTFNSFVEKYGRRGHRHITLFTIIAGIRGIPYHSTEKGVLEALEAKKKKPPRRRSKAYTLLAT